MVEIEEESPLLAQGPSSAASLHDENDDDDIQVVGSARVPPVPTSLPPPDMSPPPGTEAQDQQPPDEATLKLQAGEGEDIGQGVRKVVMKAGRKERGSPCQGSTVFVHYRAWLAQPTGTPPSTSTSSSSSGDSPSPIVATRRKIFDSRDEGQMMELIVGHEKPEHRGITLACTSMLPSERALVYVPASLAYGPQGSFSFPNVPPNADLLCEVHLIGFDAPAQDGRSHDRGSMTADERIAVADRHRQAGNELFRRATSNSSNDNNTSSSSDDNNDKNDLPPDPPSPVALEDAMSEYEVALSYMSDDFMMQMFGRYRDEANEVRVACMLNMAACQLRTDKHHEAIAMCTAVLAEDADNVKALFRRGKARRHLGQSDVAAEDLKKAARLAPGDAGIKRELLALRQEERAAREKERQMFKGVFKPPAPHPPVAWYVAVWRWVCVWLLFWLPFARQKQKQS